MTNQLFSAQAQCHAQYQHSHRLKHACVCADRLVPQTDNRAPLQQSNQALQHVQQVRSHQALQLPAQSQQVEPQHAPQCQTPSQQLQELHHSSVLYPQQQQQQQQQQYFLPEVRSCNSSPETAERPPPHEPLQSRQAPDTSTSTSCTQPFTDISYSSQPCAGSQPHHQNQPRSGQCQSANACLSPIVPKQARKGSRARAGAGVQAWPPPSPSPKKYMHSQNRRPASAGEKQLGLQQHNQQAARLKCLRQL